MDGIPAFDLMHISTGRGGRGRLKVFLGYAWGSAKSYSLLDEGGRCKERGQDVVVGATPPAAGSEIAAMLKSFEVIRQRVILGVPVMDVKAIIERHPDVCLVDELAYDNPPGERNSKRYQDVDQLLEAGISVVTSTNVQHILEMQDAVKEITGERAAETVPVEWFGRADGVVLVDPSSVVTHTDRDMARLRDLALLLAHDAVAQPPDSNLDQPRVRPPRTAPEHILIFLAPPGDATSLITRAASTARQLHAELTALCVIQPQLSAEGRLAINRYLALARHAGARVELLEGEDPVREMVRFAHANAITQIFIGQNLRAPWWNRFFGGAVARILHAVDDMDVHILPR